MLVKVVEFQRQRGGVVDRETLALLAKKVMSRMRGIGVQDTITLTEHWVKSFRTRHGLSRYVISYFPVSGFFSFFSRLRRNTTDRAQSSPEDQFKDDEWRKKVLEIIREPEMYGVAAEAITGGLPQVCCNACVALILLDMHLFPSLCGFFYSQSMIFGADETPLLYCPTIRGTYMDGKEKMKKQVMIAGSREKRMVTGMPTTSMTGGVLSFQVSASTFRELHYIYACLVCRLFGRG